MFYAAVLKKGESPPKTHDRIPLIWAFDIKVDGQYHTRLVAGGYMTTGHPEEGYAMVADLETVGLAIIAAILFKLEIVAVDVSYAYTQTFTNE
jgi:hypothetical protein